MAMTGRMEPSYHTSKAGHKIAYRQQKGEGPGVLFLCGFRSDMESTKATTLAEWCGKENIAYTRFDYFGHGKSGGEFIDFTLSRAFEDAIEILEQVATGPQIVVGSSMGGWIGLLSAQERKRQVLGFVGVAAAPDFTERMMLKKMTPEQREEIKNEGVIYVHSDYFNNDYPITLRLIEDGRKHLLLDHPIPLDLPIHLLQGQQDEDVPWELALAIAGKVTSDDVKLTLVKDGDHRLNRPQDLQLLLDAVRNMRNAL